MKATCRLLVLGWLACALLLLWLDGRLSLFLVLALPGSGVVVAGSALVRWHRAPSSLDRPLVPERHRLADDVSVPLAVVVAVAEAEAAQ